MTEPYVALLRGINVGKAKRIAMADLCKLFETLQLVDVKSLLNSGNVVFRSKRPLGKNFSATLERAIAEKLSVDCRVTLVGAHELDEIIAGNKFAEAALEPSRFLVYVLRTAADREILKPLLAQDWGREKIAAGTRWAYLWCADGILDGKLATAASRAIKDAGTSRNWATMLKLQVAANALLAE